MTNDKLPEELQERIKADADEYARTFSGTRSIKRPYIAGATAEHELAQPLVDALEKAIQHFDSIKNELANVWPELANTSKVDWVIEGEIALQQWKGEVVITPDQAATLLNPPDDNSPKGMAKPQK